MKQQPVYQPVQQQPVYQPMQQQQESSSSCRDVTLFILILLQLILLSAVVGICFNTAQTLRSLQGECEVVRDNFAQQTANRVSAEISQLSNDATVRETLINVGQTVVQNSQKEVISEFMTQLWSSVLPQNVFDSLNSFLEYNFTPLANLVANSTAGYAKQLYQKEASAADIFSLISSVSSTVARQMKPLSNNTSMPPEASIVGQLLNSLPVIAANSLKGESWRTSGRDCFDLSSQLMYTNFSGYAPGYGNWNFNDHIHNVADIMRTYCWALANVNTTSNAIISPPVYQQQKQRSVIVLKE